MSDKKRANSKLAARASAKPRSIEIAAPSRAISQEQLKQGLLMMSEATQALTRALLDLLKLAERMN